MSRNGGRSRRKATVSKPSVTPLDETLVEDSSDPENDVKPDKEWSVEAVVARRGYGDEREYNVKWNNWPSEDNTWEPASNLASCLPLVAQCDRIEDEKQRQKSNKSSKPSKSKKSRKNSSKSKGSKSKKKKKKRSKSGSKKATRITIEAHSESENEPEPEIEIEPEIEEPEPATLEVNVSVVEESPEIITKRQSRKSTVKRKRSKRARKESESDQMEVDEVNESVLEEIADPQNEEEELADEDWDTEEHYEVEFVVKHRKSVKKDYPKKQADGTRCHEYFVKWKGWDASTNTWEHEDALTSCVKLIDAYWTRREQEQQEKERLKKEKAAQRKAERERKMKKKAAKSRKQKVVEPEPEVESEPEPEMEVEPEPVVESEPEYEPEPEPVVEAEPEPVEEVEEESQTEMDVDPEPVVEPVKVRDDSGSAKKVSKKKQKRKKRRRKTNHRAVRVAIPMASEDPPEVEVQETNGTMDESAISAVHSTVGTVNMTVNESAFGALDDESIDDTKSREEDANDADHGQPGGGASGGEGIDISTLDIDISHIQMEDDELEDSVIDRNTQRARRKSSRRNPTKSSNRNSRKRSLFECDDDIEMDEQLQQPPVKKRRIQETRKWIENSGVNLFFKVLDDGNEEDQEVLMNLVQKYH